MRYQQNQPRKQPTATRSAVAGTRLCRAKDIRIIYVLYMYYIRIVYVLYMYLGEARRRRRRGEARRGGSRGGAAAPARGGN